MTIHIDRTEHHQIIEGFGASLAAAWHAVCTGPAEFSSEERERALDMLFTDRGARLSIVRLHTPCYTDPGVDYRIRSHEPEEGVLEWGNDAGQVAGCHGAMDRGVEQFLASPWSPPGWMKNTGEAAGLVNGRDLRGGKLREDCYERYADYLATYVHEYRTRHRVPIGWLSLQNEPLASPDWAGCTFTPAEFRRWARVLRAKLDEAGVDVKLLAPEGTGISATHKLLRALRADADAWDAVDTVGSHDYYGRSPTEPIDPPIDAGNRPLWMTERTEHGSTMEHALMLGLRMQQWLVDLDATAYLYWLCTSFPHHHKHGAQALIRSVPDEGRLEPNKKLFVMAQHSRFVRPGHQRVTADAPQEDGPLRVSAYRDPQSDRVCVVAVNPAGKPVQQEITGLRGRALQRYETSDAHDCTALEEVLVEDGTAEVHFPTCSVTTLVEA